MRLLTRQEELVLLAIFQLKGSTGLVQIRDFLNDHTGRDWSISSVYVPLSRLTNEGLLSEKIGQPTAKRGGKAIKFYEISRDGLKVLRELDNLNQVMWKGLQWEIQ